MNKNACSRVFTQKGFGADLYTWSPQCNQKQNNNNNNNNRNSKPYFCNATPNSQGQDWVSTYSYNINVTPEGVQERNAYVECGYWE